MRMRWIHNKIVLYSTMKSDRNSVKFDIFTGSKSYDPKPIPTFLGHEPFLIDVPRVLFVEKLAIFNGS